MRPRHPAWFSFLLALALFLPGLLSPRDFIAGDEARYAEVLREMEATGNWLVLRVDGQIYSDKPPLYFWLANLAAHGAGRITPVCFLLVTWLSAAGTVALTHLIARRLYGEAAGWWSALILLSSILFLGCAQIVRMDMTMSFFIVLAFWALLRDSKDSRREALWLFHLASALAVLSKGPLGFVIPFLAATAFLIHRRRWPALRRLVLHPALLAAALLIGGWLGAARMSGGQELAQDIWSQQIVSRMGRSAVQRQPFYFYIALLPLLLLPWSPFLYRAIRQAMRERADGSLLLLWWLAGGIALISAISGKLFVYLLPMIPPAAILMGRLLAGSTSPDVASRRAFRWEGSLAILATSTLAAAIPFAAAQFADLGPFSPWSATALFALLGLLAAPPLWRADLRGVATILLTITALLSTLIFSIIAPRANRTFSDRGLAVDLVRRAQAGAKIATFHLSRGMCSFYADAVFPKLSADRIGSHLFQPAAVVAMPMKDFAKHRAQIGTNVEVLATYVIVGRPYVVVGRTH